MEARALLDALHVAERLKDETRHCYTSGGRHESVAEHSWRIALMAFWMKDEFPDVDIDKVIRMCLIHDLGEMEALYREMIALETPEAKLYKAMDKLEAIVQHNESDIATWEPHEYQLNMTYADDAVAWSPVLRELREAIRNDTKAKIAAAEQQA